MRPNLLVAAIAAAAVTAGCRGGKGPVAREADGAPVALRADNSCDLCAGDGCQPCALPATMTAVTDLPALPAECSEVLVVVQEGLAGPGNGDYAKRYRQKGAKEVHVVSKADDFDSILPEGPRTWRLVTIVGHGSAGVILTSGPADLETSGEKIPSSIKKFLARTVADHGTLRLEGCNVGASACRPCRAAEVGNALACRLFQELPNVDFIEMADGSPWALTLSPKASNLQASGAMGLPCSFTAFSTFSRAAPPMVPKSYDCSHSTVQSSR